MVLDYVMARTCYFSQRNNISLATLVLVKVTMMHALKTQKVLALNQL